MPSLRTKSKASRHLLSVPKGKKPFPYFWSIVLNSLSILSCSNSIFIVLQNSSFEIIIFSPSIHRPPVIKQPTIVVAFSRNIFIRSILVCCSFLHPFLAFAVFRILNVSSGSHKFNAVKAVINISDMRRISLIIDYSHQIRPFTNPINTAPAVSCFYSIM